MAINYSDYMSNMTASTLPSELDIKKRYLTALEENKAKNQALADAEKQTIQGEIDSLNKKYQPASNEAYLTAAKTQRQNAENLANMGLSSDGGTSRTLKDRVGTNLTNKIGTIELQKAEDKTEKENAIREIDTSTAAKNATFEQAASEDLANELKKAKERIYSVALTLLNKKYITKKQFEEMTGVKINAVSSSKSNSSAGSSLKKVSNFSVEAKDTARQGILAAAKTASLLSH